MQGIGSSLAVGPKLPYHIKFACDPNKEYQVELCIADLSRLHNLVILGKGFLKRFASTEFDWGNHKIRLGDRWLFLIEKEEEWKMNPKLTQEQQDNITEVLKRFNSLFSDNPLAPKACSTIRHKINSKDPAIVRDKTRRIPDKWKEDVGKQIAEMLEHTSK